MSKQLDAMVEAAEAAAKIQRGFFGASIEAEKKSPRELVTKVDILSQQAIVSILQKRFPAYGVLAEESGLRKEGDGHRWIIDPLDGTHNFFYGVHLFGVSIALEKNGEIEAAVINLPALKEVYIAEKGKGCFKNGKLVKVSKRRLDQAVLNICSGLWHDPKAFEKSKKILSSSFSNRVFGASCFVLSGIASGKIDAVVEFHDRVWDYAAGWLLVEEAGGKFTAFNGEKMSLGKSSYIASNGVFHEKLVEMVEATE